MIRASSYVPIPLLFTLLLSPPCLSFAGKAPPDDVRNAAQVGINVILKDSRMGNLHRLGFQSQEDIDSANLGKGFQIFTIPPDKLLNETTPLNLQALVTPTNQWQFLIAAGDKAKALLTVEFVDGKWIPVSIGSAALAKELSDFLDAWPASSGYDYRLIRVFQAKSEFIELTKGGKVIGIVSLSSLSLATSRGEAEAANLRGLRDSNEVLSELKFIVRNHLQFNK